MYENGRIVWGFVKHLGGKTDKNGMPGKDRPLVILASDDDRVWGVICSNKAALQNPRPTPHVVLPFSPDGTCHTKLEKPTLALCFWYDYLEKSEIRKTGGCIPGAELLEILKHAHARLGTPLPLTRP